MSVSFFCTLSYVGMKTKLALLLSLLIVECGLHAQNFCKRTSVFFESDAAELTEQTKRKLDSLGSVMRGTEYIVELYGHADSVGNYDYNYRLANQRMRAISNYLRTKCTARITFTENNLSETNYQISKDQEKNLAYNRRVDIFFIPVSGGKVQMSGKNQGSVEAPPALFGPCGICNSTPAVKTFMTREETDKANILLKTTEGDSLITDGMIMLNYNPCGGVTKIPTVTFKMCPGKPDPRMKLWEADTVKGKIVWKPSKDSLRFDYTTGCYTFTGRPGKIYNIDKRFVAGPPPPFIPDTFCRIVPSLAFAYEHFLTTDLKKMVKYKAKRDSLDIGRQESQLVAHAIAKKGKEYYIFTKRIDSLPYSQYAQAKKIVRSYKIPVDSFQKLEYTDTLLKVRCGKRAQTGQCGLYLEEFKEFIPFDSTDGKYYYGRKPVVAYQYAYMKGKRLFVLHKEPVKEKYSEEKKTARIKFKKRQRRKFKSVTNYNMAPF